MRDGTTTVIPESDESQCWGVRVSTGHSLTLSTSFHPNDNAPNDARRTPTVVRRSTLTCSTRRLTQLDSNVRFHHSLSPVLFTNGCTRCCPDNAGFRPLLPLHRFGITLQLVWFLSFAHVVRSSIYALSDGRPAVSPCVCSERSPSPPLCWTVSRAFIFSHLYSSHPSLSSSAHQPYAPSHSGAQINTLRAQLDAKPDAERHPTVTKVMRRSPIMRKPTSAPESAPAPHRVGERISALRFSHDHLGECVCCDVA